MIWGSYVVLAGDLVGQESEAAKRSAVSRAYYGAFNAARRCLEAHGMTIENHRAHHQVWRTFKTAERASEADGNWQAIGELGSGLRGLRNQADYADVVRSLDRRAEWAVDAAHRILVLLDELEFS
jgi:uncharacterized protein (UPF0332 family)